MTINVKELIALLKANTILVTVEFIVDALTKCEAVIARLRARNNALHKAIGDAGVTVKSKLKDGKWSWTVKLPPVKARENSEVWRAREAEQKTMDRLQNLFAALAENNIKFEETPTRVNLTMPPAYRTGIRDASIASLLRALSSQGIHATPTGFSTAEGMQWEVVGLFTGANYKTAYDAAILQNKGFETQIKRADIWVQKLSATLVKAGVIVHQHSNGPNDLRFTIETPKLMQTQHHQDLLGVLNAAHVMTRWSAQDGWSVTLPPDRIKDYNTLLGYYDTLLCELSKLGVTYSLNPGDAVWDWEITLPADEFKTYVHKRLDDAGVPKEFPNGPHSKNGCRIGDRLDWLLTALQTNFDKHVELTKQLRAVGVEFHFVTAHGWSVSLPKQKMPPVPPLNVELQGELERVQSRLDRQEKRARAMVGALDDAGVYLRGDDITGDAKVDVRLPIQLTPIADGIEVRTQRNWMCEPKQYTVKASTPGYDLIYRLYSDTMPLPAKA